MRYVILLRHGFFDYAVALKLTRSRDGHIACVEHPQPDRHRRAPGMTWRRDGRYSLIRTDGSRQPGTRTPLDRVEGPEIAYRVPGVRLLDLPTYDSSQRGATVQLDGEVVRQWPRRVELQLLLCGNDTVPEHRETLGERRIDDGDPSIWVVLAHENLNPAGAMARYATKPTPTLTVSVEPYSHPAAPNLLSG